MALRSHEYVECQEERKRPLILSEVGVDLVSHANKLKSLTVLGNSLPELTRIVASAHASPSTHGINGIPPLPSIRSFLSSALRELETNTIFIAGSNNVR